MEVQTQARQVHLRAEATIGTRRRTPEGYLRAQAALIRTGVLQFLGAELGLTGQDAQRRHGVLFGRDTVFDQRTLNSVHLKPVTFGHPSQDVTPQNHSVLAVGHLGDDVQEIEGGRLGTSMLLTSPAAITAVEQGVEETSIGFYSKIVPEAGESGGEPFSFKLSGPLQVNHLAIVGAGRAGPTVRIFNEERPMTDEELKKLVNEAVSAALPGQEQSKKGGKDSAASPVDVEKLAGEIVSRFENAMAEANKANVERTSPGGEATDDSEKDVTALAAVRADLIINAKPLLPKDADPKTMSDREIIVAALGDSVKGPETRTDDYLRGQLDSLVASRARAADERTKLTNSGQTGGAVQPVGGNFLELRARFKEGK